MPTVSPEQVYTEYSGKVMGYIRARIRSGADAEDLHSEVFEKVLRKLDGFDPSKASLSTWIFTITRNTVIDHFRRTRPSEELDENLAPKTGLSIVRPWKCPYHNGRLCIEMIRRLLDD